MVSWRERKKYQVIFLSLLSLYSDELMQAGFHAQSGIRGQLDPADEEEDPEETNPTGF